MIYDDLPVFPPIETETFLSLKSKFENTPEEIYRRNQWGKNATKIFIMLKINRKAGIHLIERFFEKVDGIGTLHDDLSEALYLNELIKLYDRETKLRPENPRNWKFLGFANFLKCYFSPSRIGYQKTAEYYAETIRRVSNYPNGYINGLIMARIGGSTPNRLRYELGLALGMLGDFDSSLYHLKIHGAGEEFLQRFYDDPEECLLQEVFHYYSIRLSNKLYCLDTP
ncbi:MAG: hypothetical protein CVU40_03810 [Chloroflexi bacterium HGW-Chloroflexi-2]|jgi:hypothetical protein|nr:MAG: hypothetical protein CVU40_03810 [Chloroflexi bacterium HGW-Chloroflexi-2]